jgi:predicted hotdog family 3-hydroxylacyl-ACP dehydratase
LEQVIQFLKPMKPQLQSMAVESTFSWYWPVDGLLAANYPIDLASQLIAQVQAEHIQALGKSISRIEKGVLASARQIPLLAESWECTFMSTSRNCG